MLSLPFAGLISHFIGLIYPAYRSFKAIETREPGDDAQWLTYWVAFSSLEILDVVSFGIIEWVPLYYEAKIIFCMWLFLPQTQGASYLYEKHIKPFLTEYASKIDPVFAGTQEVLESENVASAIKMVEQYGPQVAEQALQAAVKTAQELAESAKETNEAKTD